MGKIIKTIWVEVPVQVEVYYSKAERMTHDYPGCEAEAEGGEVVNKDEIFELIDAEILKADWLAMVEEDFAADAQDAADFAHECRRDDRLIFEAA